MSYIARLAGEVIGRGPDHVVIDVGGVGYRAFVPASTAAGAPVGGRMALHTHLQIRDDGAALFGFSEEDELALFEQLITVSGVGPRSALALLSVVPARDLRIAIAGGAVEVLRRVPGIGPRTAARIILELQPKIEVGMPAEAGAPAGSDDVVAALRTLGFSQQEIAAGLAATAGTEETSTEARLEAVLRHMARTPI